MKISFRSKSKRYGFVCIGPLAGLEHYEFCPFLAYNRNDRA